MKNLPMHLISSGIEHHQAGRLADAEVIYRQVLRAEPNHADALHWLGMIAHQMGKNDAALELVQKAIGISAGVPAYYSHLGMIYKGLKKFDEAVTSFQQAIVMKPDYAEAFNNLGNLFRVQCKLEKAISSYQKALTLNADLVEAYKNIGDILKMQGKTSQALTHYKKARLVAPASFSAQDAALSTAILHYVANDLKGARKQLDFAKQMSGGISSASVASQAYCNYLEFLLTWWQAAGTLAKPAAEIKKLYVVGESHSLSLQNIIVSIENEPHCCQAKWIEGCKQWHLANKESNIYKYQLSKVIGSLPTNASVLLTIGEIDCRDNTGIFPLWKKNNGNIQDIVETTVNGYLNYVYPLAVSRGIKLIINGVPASNAILKNLSNEDVREFGCFLICFNKALKKSALDRNMAFLDVFSLTDTGNGFADGSWHLDSHHLRPDAMGIAFVQQYKKLVL